MAQLKSLLVEGVSRFIGGINTDSNIYYQTKAAGTNDTTLATTAFVTTAVQNAINAVKP